MKNLSIIIPTLNEELYISDVLEAISKQQYPYELEVIVIDGSSGDKTVEVAKSFLKKIDDLKIIGCKTRGVSLQRNKGAKIAKHESLLFIDADVIFPDDFLINLLGKKINNNEIVLVAHYPPNFNFLDYLWLCMLYSFLIIVKFYKPICSGSFLLISNKYHKKVGGFDENTVMGGDVIYGLAAIDCGAKYRLIFKPYVLSFPRRLRKEGRIRLLTKWFRGYKYMVKNGPIYADANLHNYEFGNYTKENKN